LKDNVVLLNYRTAYDQLNVINFGSCRSQ